MLAWTAASMIAGEPYFESLFEKHFFLKTMLYPLIIGGVLGLAWLRKPRKEVLQ